MAIQTRGKGIAGLFVAVGLSVATLPSYAADMPPAQRIERTAKKVGEAIERTGKRAVNAVERGAKHADKALTNAAEKTDNWVKQKTK
jgi:hypothetical protein